MPKHAFWTTLDVINEGDSSTLEELKTGGCFNEDLGPLCGAR